MYEQLKNYFQFLAEKNKQIKDSVGYFSREIIEKSSSFSGIASPFLAVYNYEVGLEGGQLNTIGSRKIVFSIIYADTPHDDFNAQQYAIDQAEQIAFQLLARIRWDNSDPKHFLYGAFQKEMTKIFTIEEPQANFYGVEVELYFHTPQSLKVDPNHWEDTFLTC